MADRVSSTPPRLRQPSLLLLLVLALAGVVPPSPSTAQEDPLPQRVRDFFGYTRPAEYDVLTSHLRVPTRDGTELGCTLYRPATDGVAEDGPFPSIVTGFTPYFAFHLAEIESYGDFYATHGYNAVLCAPRGTGTSGGVWPGWFSATEAEDNYDLIEWLADQPWSTDRIGQEGQSYGGIASYRVATLNPPSLRAIAPQQAFHSAYLDYSYPGGIRSTGDPFLVARRRPGSRCRPTRRSHAGHRLGRPSAA
jgi:uncharacterized protein